MTNKQETIQDGILDFMFGKFQEDSIYLPEDGPYKTRFNCKMGGIYKDETTRLADECPSILVGCSKFYGSLGKTQNTVWMQILYVPLLTETKIPRNTVCSAYLKNESLTQFGQMVTELQTSGKNPARGVWNWLFKPKQGEDGPYFIVCPTWKPLETPQEIKLYNLCNGFLGTNPQMLDLSTTRDMIPVAGKSNDYIMQVGRLCLEKGVSAPVAASMLDSGVDSGGKLSLPQAS